ncbi:antibiotic biosynthesis monooxygenase [Pseudomonas daroniae]|uniref:Antibiotic biosynthesis monooxygenase n=1 Tax=Phytopseudomonas daroniae TaxID=2487519 RepID=A0A4Q9QKC4_9GAMM|nr:MULTISPECIES: antibiotic biosynthesis monooxygenase [Pseudomonas]TBU79225.1 antibiotic biosynthesis monooxygenase [Pseudomonas daroniae]TBU80007.1 antibiotic biosynthesis monooxygenase [Pseudomonas sp. FRB 228]TBU91325.1 antibiotic biosynthesis monooxygenase [Pseudomonas daroniae]
MNQTSADTVTLVVRHQVRQHHEQHYETWLRQIIDTASRCPGHLGVDVVRGRQAGFVNFTCVLRFDQLQHMQSWLDSEARTQLVAEVQPLLRAGDNTEILLGKDFWFRPDNAQQPPPRWKQACVTFLVILPLSLLVPLLWQPLFQRIPWLGGYVPSNLLITLSIVLLVVYLFMPMATRLFAAWLNPTPDEDRP